MFLPIYFFTLVAAFRCGWKVGLLTAVLSPVVNCLLFGMPPGASMGHGLFAVSAQKPVSVRAQFTCCCTSFELKLKPEFESLIKADIEKGVAQYGHAPAYWNYVRHLALTYWRDWDRTQLFDVI